MVVDVIVRCERIGSLFLKTEISLEAVEEVKELALCLCEFLDLLTAFVDLFGDLSLRRFRVVNEDHALHGIECISFLFDVPDDLAQLLFDPLDLLLCGKKILSCTQSILFHLLLFAALTLFVVSDREVDLLAADVAHFVL